jgi:hypothetical protein
MKTTTKNLRPNRPPAMPITTAAMRVIVEAGLKFAAEMAMSGGVGIFTREVQIGLGLLERDGELKP